MHIVLFQPDIALNVGATIRTAACLDCPVDVILPCGFPFSSNTVKRSALDYFDMAKLTVHASWDAFSAAAEGQRLILLTTKGNENASNFAFKPSDYLIFGRESAGAPDYVHEAATHRVRLPMAGDARALNLSISVAMTLTLAYQGCGLFHQLE